MDHLPYPKNPAYLPLSIPNLVNPGTLVDCRANGAVERYKANAGTRSLQGLTPNLQKWLYFGLLSTCIRDTVAVQTFDDNGHLSSKKLPSLLRSNLRAIQGNDGVEQLLREVEVELRAFTIDFLDSRSRHHNVADHDTAQQIILSIRVLVDSLWRAYRNSKDYAQDTCMRHHERYDNPFAPAGLDCIILRNRMSWENGWCTSMVSSLLQTFTASTMYYISAIGRPHFDDGAPNYKDCTSDRCRLVYDEGNYQQAHTHRCQINDSAGCRMFLAPLRDVMNILQEGGIPLMKLESNALVAGRAEYGLPCVAATHVWAGGLGNPKSNAMRLCQLQEIVRLTAVSQSVLRGFEPSRGPEGFFPTVWDTMLDPLRLFPKSVPESFWIDTLNIPRVDEEDASTEDTSNVRDRRTDAIDRMTQTYAAADSAVVLDPELRQLALQWNQSATEPDSDQSDQVLLQIFCSILVSSWMTRCWTYQEGAMAKELLIQLNNSLFPMRFARSNVIARNRRALRNCDYSDMHDMLDETSAWFSRLPATGEDDAAVGRKEISQGSDGPLESSEDGGRPEIFTRIWNDVGARSTSRTVDRLSILCMLIDLRPSDVRQEHPRARLKAIFKAQKKLPLALLFQPPLTAEERREASDEFHKEEEAERDRGRILRHYVEDVSYPLPTSLRSKPLPGQLGWMQLGGSQENFVYFNNGLLRAGSRRPSLFKLPRHRGGRATKYTLYDRSIPFRFDMHLDLAQKNDYPRWANDSDLYLLASSALQGKDTFQLSHTTFYGLLLTLEGTGSENTMNDAHTPRDFWQFRYNCHVSCDSFLALGPNSNEASAGHMDIVRQVFTEDCDYRIHCNFSDVTAPSGHRIHGFIPAWVTALDIQLTVMPLLVFYYLVCFSFMCIPVFAHTLGTFPKGWLAMIAFLIMMRWLFFTWNNFREYTKAANEIIFNEWVNGIGGVISTPQTSCEH